MGKATREQIITLKKIVKDNPAESRAIVKGVQFDELTEEQASDLISKCNEHINGTNTQNGNPSNPNRNNSYKKNDNGSWKPLLTKEQLDKVREDYREYSKDVMHQCEKDFPDDKDKQMAVFYLRCEKPYTWEQRAREEKGKQTRE